MQPLVVSCLAVFVGMLIHWLWWRVSAPRPAHQKKILLLIFVAVTAAVFLLSITGGLPLTLEQAIASCLFVLGYAGSYLISYTLIETDGPTFLILLALDRVEQRGLTKEELGTFVTNDIFIHHRLTGLLTSGHVIEEEGHYKITPAGERSLKIYNIPRRMLGITESGG